MSHKKTTKSNMKMTLETMATRAIWTTSTLSAPIAISLPSGKIYGPMTTGYPKPSLVHHLYMLYIKITCDAVYWDLPGFMDAVITFFETMRPTCSSITYDDVHSLLLQ